MSYEYDEYYEGVESAVEEAMSEMVETKNDDTFFNINLNKEMIRGAFNKAIKECCEDLMKEVKVEIINNVKKTFIEDNFDETLEDELRKSIKTQTDNILENFMDREITISDGYWQTKKIKCSKFIEEHIDESLKKNVDRSVKDFVEKTIDYRIEKKIENYESSLRNETRNKIDEMFNQTTKNALSEQLFYILSQNETYQKIQSGINSLIEEK